MPKCPACESFRIVVVVGPWPSAWCDTCGARWIQEGSEQRSIMREPVALAGRVQRIAGPAGRSFLALADLETGGFGVGRLVS